MRVLLVRPVRPTHHILNCVPPIGLGYLSTALKRTGHEVQIIDCIKTRMTHQELLSRIMEYQPQIVGFTVFSSDLKSVHTSIGDLRAAKADFKIIVGGPHPSGLPEGCLESLPGADFGFRGEAEIGLPQLLDILDGKSQAPFDSVPGLIWRTSTGICANIQAYPENLDELGMPDWDAMDPRTYPDAPQGVIFRHTPIAPLMITRGCPFKCTFCAGKTVTGRRLRSRSLDSVFEEINLLATKYGVRELHILDDNFSMKRDYVHGFCERLIKENRKLTWCCPNGLRLDSLDTDTVKLMKRAGCYYISVGIESGSDRILSLMKKSLTLEEIRRQVWMVKNAGVDVNGFFILGFPGETRAEIEETIRLSKELPLSRAQFYSFMPLPSTENYEALVASGELKEVDWENAFQTEISYVPKGMTVEELKALQKRAHREFYLRPRIMLDLLSQMRSFNQMKYIARRAYAYAFAN